MEPIKRYHANVNGKQAFYIDKNKNQKADKGEIHSSIDRAPNSEEESAKLEDYILASKGVQWTEVINRGDFDKLIQNLNVITTDDVSNGLYDVLLKSEIYDKQQVDKLLTSVAKVMGDDIGYTFEFLTDAIISLREAGVNDPAKITKTLIYLSEVVGKDVDWAYKEIPKAIDSIREVGIIEPAKITEMLVKLADAAGEGTGLAYNKMPAAIKSIKEVGIIDPSKISDVQISLASAKENTGWVYRELPSVVSAIKEAGISQADSIRMLKTLSTVTGKQAGFVYENLPATIKAISDSGIHEPDKISIMLMALANTAGKYTFRVYDALPDMLSAGITDPAKMIAVLNTVTAVAGDDIGEALASFSGIIKNQQQAFSNDFEGSLRKLKGLIIFSTHSPQCVVDNLATLFSSDVIKLDFTEFDIVSKTDKSKYDLRGFATYLAYKMNSLSSEEKSSLDFEFNSQLAVLVNNIHESDVALTRTDNFRETFCKELDDENVCYLMARGGKDLYTSTFNKLYANSSFQAKITDFDNYISSLVSPSVEDRNKQNTEDVMGLMLTMFQFKKVELIGNSSKIVDVMINALDERDNDRIMTNTALIVSGVRRMGELGKHHGKLGMYLIEQSRLIDNNQSTRSGCIKYLIKQLALQLEPLMEGCSLVDVAESFPKVELTPHIPRDRWIGSDNTLTAKLYFYSDEKWYGITKNYYAQSGYEIDKDYMSQNHLDSESYSVFKRVENGVTLRVILTNNENDDRETSINSDEVDIIVHRGHSFHLNETFPTYVNVTAKDKLIFGGSCGSYRDMVSGEFLMAYKNNYFIADQNTGQGAVNNRLLNSLMKNTARGELAWEDVLPTQDTNGIVLPNDPAFLLSQYLFSLNSNQIL